MTTKTIKTGRQYNGEQILHYGRVGKWLWIADPSRELAYVVDGSIYDTDDANTVLRAYDSKCDTWNASDDHRTARLAAVKILSDLRRHKCCVQRSDEGRARLGYVWLTAKALEGAGAWRTTVTTTLRDVRRIAESSGVASQYSDDLCVELSMA